MHEQLRQTVPERPDHRCECCCLPQDAEPFFAYHVEHIVARQHGGSDDNENLALACYHCNAHKDRTSADLTRKAERLSDSLIRGWTSGKSTSSTTESLLSGELR
jgi:5-methylcytosine-specific restriction endonuclease McrA